MEFTTEEYKTLSNIVRESRERLAASHLQGSELFNSSIEAEIDYRINLQYKIDKLIFQSTTKKRR